MAKYVVYGSRSRTSYDGTDVKLTFDNDEDFKFYCDFMELFNKDYYDSVNELIPLFQAVNPKPKSFDQDFFDKCVTDGDFVDFLYHDNYGSWGLDMMEDDLCNHTDWEVRFEVLGDDYYRKIN